MACTVKNREGEVLKISDLENIMGNDELSILNKIDGDVEFLLENNVLALVHSHGNPLTLDVKGELDYHNKYFSKNSYKKEPLARALGLHVKRDSLICDATAGTLSDSLLIYAMGGRVISFERNSIPQVLIINALKNFPLENYVFYPMDVKKFSNFDDFDALYFDPMYKTLNTKSLPRKEMQVFREEIGHDPDIEETFLFLKSQGKRLVMKRSKKAKPLETPQISYSGKSTVYDVYLP